MTTTTPNITYIQEILGETIADYTKSYECGRFEIDDIELHEYEDGSILTAEVSGSYEIEGYTEDDYFSGTGGYVVTRVEINLYDCKLHRYDEDGNELAHGIDSLDYYAIEQEAKRWWD